MDVLFTRIVGLFVLVWTICVGVHGAGCPSDGITVNLVTQEEQAPGNEIGNIASRLNASLGPPYTENFFLEPWISNTFDIDYSSGIIKNKVRLDREKNETYTFVVTKDQTVAICIKVTLTDVNEFAPTFSNTRKTLTIPEGAPHHKVSLGSAEDLDIGDNTIAGYRLIYTQYDNNSDYPFNVTARYSGPQKLLLDLGINGTLDFEGTRHYQLIVEVYDKGSPALSSQMQVNVSIIDTNDNYPVFNFSKYSAEVFENISVGTSVLQVEATDLDSGDNGRVSYTIDKNTDPDHHFAINPASGVLSINRLLDYEQKKNYQLLVIASDNGNQSNTSPAVVEIDVKNINELPANIYLQYLTGDSTPRLAENASVGYPVARISVSDPESPETENIFVSLEGDRGHFALKNTSAGTFQLSVSGPLDREAQAFYNITLTAADTGSPPLSARKSFTLEILDVNDHAPAFSEQFYNTEVQEMSDAGSSVLLVTATDLDIGDNARIRYQLQDVNGGNSEWFEVDPTSGLITTRGQVDCEVDPHPTVVIVASDFGSPSLSSSATVYVSVRDINDKEPTFDQTLYEASVMENTTTSSCIIQVNATDPDCGVNGQIRYSISPDSHGSDDWFYVEETSGRICIRQELDHETNSIHEFSVIAKDSGDFASTANVRVSIIDINDNLPVFYPRNYSKNILYSSKPNFEIISVQATDEDDGAFGKVSYSIQSGNSERKFSIDANTGSIILREALPPGEGLYHLKVGATDGGGRSAELSAEVEISVIGTGYSPPQFERSMYRFTVREDENVGISLGTVRATYNGQTTGIRYSIESGDKNAFFTINKDTGVIRSAKTLDHDEYPHILLNIKAAFGDIPVFGSAQVNVTIEDVNDNAPVFSSTHVTSSVSEAITSTIIIYSAHAVDKDSRANGNGEVRYQLMDNPEYLFSIDATNGDVTLAPGKQLDYELTTRHTLVIIAYDQGQEEQLSSSMTLVINVQDANDNSPVFARGFVESILEADPVSSKFLQIQATDKDHGDNGRLTFSLIESEFSHRFGINPPDGVMFLREQLDREEKSEYHLQVTAHDHGQPSRTATTSVTIFVLDANDNTPIFSQPEYHFFVEEKRPLGTSVGLIIATDSDSGNNALLQYDFSSTQNDFSISNMGLISSTRSLDREVKPSYDIEVIVQDSGSPMRQAKARVVITITDINDHSPEIKNSAVVEQVEENRSKGVRVVQIIAEDPDAGENGTLTFALRDDDQTGVLDYFAIHPKTGWITTREVLDYETKSSYNFKVVVSDGGNPSRSTVQAFTIKVKDDNDEAPVFQDVNMTFYIVENIPIGTTVGQVQAYDRDGGENGRVSYYVIGGNHFGLFAVDLESGNIYTIREIDFEESSSHTVGIQAIDNSVYNPKSSVITIKLFVTDINDNAPIFEHDPVFLTVRENVAISSVIHTFTAIDADSGNNGTVRYEITNTSAEKKLEIDPYTGRLSVTANIDYEEVKDISLVIRAYDLAPTTQSQLFTTVTVMILVLDANDNAPVFPTYQEPFQVLEDEPVGYRIASLVARDADGNVNMSNNNRVLYSIVSGNLDNAFHIEEGTGVLTINTPLDRERNGSYSLGIQARDMGSPSLQSSVTVMVKVLDVNDNPPHFQRPSYQADVMENSLPGTLITKLFATDPDQGVNQQLTYMLPEGVANGDFEIDPMTGVITLVTDDLDRESKSSYVLTAYVQDAGSPTLFDMTTIIINVTDVNDSPPVFKDKTYFLEIPENTVQEMIHTFVAHDADTGDNARVRYSITAGNKDGKFSLNTDSGVLACVDPLDREIQSSYSLTIQATDGQHASSCSLNIRVKDVNDNDPMFVQGRYTKDLYENVAVGTSVVTVRAEDKDVVENGNGNVTYSLHNDTDAGLFVIDSITGLITTKSNFDREKQQSFSFDAVASDGGLYDPRSSKVRVDITILDINDNIPVFQEVPYRKNISHDLGRDMLVLTVVATDKDEGRNQDIVYSLSQPSNYFKVDNSGQIKTKVSLGSAAIGYHNLHVIATDGGVQPLSSTGVVEIMVGTTGSGQKIQFRNHNYTASLYENAQPGTQVTSVELESTPSVATFSFASGNDGDAFSISSSGMITVSNPGPIDYEVSSVMRLIVEASSAGNFAYTTVWISLINVNDNKPQFSQDKYTTKVFEEQPKNTYVMQVTATDADNPGPTSDIVYNIIQGNIDQAFIIDPPNTGILKTNLIVDYEIRSSYKLIIEAKDFGVNNTLSSTCTVKISVIDVNDNPPKFPNTAPVNASEATEVGSSLTLVTANDIDMSPPITYKFSLNGNPDGMFNIDRYNGIIRLAKPLDHERRNQYTIGLQVTDGKHIAYTSLQLNVLDENDNSPVFSKQSYQVSLEELTPPNVKVLQVNTTDDDFGMNAAIKYSLAVAPSHGFYINEETGTIFTNETVKYHQQQEIIQLVVTATDGGSPSLSTVVAVYIQVTSVNKYAPEFSTPNYKTTINEDAERGFVVMHVEATDKDTSGRNKEIDYKVVMGNINDVFVIDQKEGRIILNKQLDREQISEYNLVVMAQDRGVPKRNSSVSVHIIIQDVNDQVPYFEFSEYFVALNESFPSDRVFLRVQAFDNDTDANSKIYYAITSGNEEGLFIVNNQLSAGELVITPNLELDYEKHSNHKLIIRAQDCNGCPPDRPKFSNVTTVYINVSDVNEFGPAFPVKAYYRGVRENMTIGSNVFEAHANDKDGGYFGIVQYTLSGSSRFSIHYRTGQVTTNEMFDFETAVQTEFSFQITAEDNGGYTATVPVFLSLVDVDESAPTFEKSIYTFEVPGSALNGTIIGSVRASDDDTGNAGKIVYRFNPPQDYFGINSASGEIRVIHDLNMEIASNDRRQRREVKMMKIEASSGLEDSIVSAVWLNISVDRSCFGCEMQRIQVDNGNMTASESMNVAIIIGIVVSIVAVALIVIIGFILCRRRYNAKTPPPSETAMCAQTDEFDSIPQHQTGLRNPPPYSDVIRFGNHSMNVTTSSDMSHQSHRSGSSGRGSAEDDEDEELAMINSSSPSYLNNSNGFRKAMPDSGIQDDDNTSEPSVQNHQDYLARLGIDTAKINSKAKSGLNHSVESMHQFSDSGGGEGDGMDIEPVDYSKMHGPAVDQSSLLNKNNVMGFHEPENHMVGSLSNVINSEEEYSGSYNWDYLLDWGPQYQPLAHVFSEIARLKDDTIQPKMQAVQIVPQRNNGSSSNQVRMVPPPMITNAPPKAIVPPSSRSNRSSHSSGGSNVNSTRNSTINTSLPSMPRSPISHESSFTSPALTPSFTPSLSPLATRSPSISPVNSGRGLVSSNHSSGPATPRGRSLNNNNNNSKYGFSSSSSEQELRI